MIKNVINLAPKKVIPMEALKAVEEDMVDIPVKAIMKKKSGKANFLKRRKVFGAMMYNFINKILILLEIQKITHWFKI